jgi:hypothetical protein
MSRSDRRADRRRRRSVLGVGTAAGAAFAAALIGLAHAPAGRADTEPDPFQLLFGDSGINTWTPTADTDLAALSPTLAADFETSVDYFDPVNSGFFIDDPFSNLAYFVDPSGFSADPLVGGLPDNAIGDFGVSLDYTLFATGLGNPVDFFLDGLLSELGVIPDL